MLTRICSKRRTASSGKPSRPHTSSSTGLETLRLPSVCPYNGFIPPHTRGLCRYTRDTRDPRRLSTTTALLFLCLTSTSKPMGFLALRKFCSRESPYYVSWPLFRDSHHKHLTCLCTKVFPSSVVLEILCLFLLLIYLRFFIMPNFSGFWAAHTVKVCRKNEDILTPYLLECFFLVW